MSEKMVSVSSKDLEMARYMLEDYLMMQERNGLNIDIMNRYRTNIKTIMKRLKDADNQS